MYNYSSLNTFSLCNFIDFEGKIFIVYTGFYNSYTIELKCLLGQYLPYEQRVVIRILSRTISGI
jgi:hypothetical protein